MCVCAHAIDKANIDMAQENGEGKFNRHYIFELAKCVCVCNLIRRCTSFAFGATAATTSFEHWWGAQDIGVHVQCVCVCVLNLSLSKSALSCVKQSGTSTSALAAGQRPAVVVAVV